MNKKGFTLIELITTFALASVVLILLVNIIVMIKNIYTETDTKTELLINQANLSKQLNSKLSDGNIKSYKKCDDSSFCYNFTLPDGEVVKLAVSSDKIKFSSYTYKMLDGTIISNPYLTYDGEFLVIKIPIKNKLYAKDDFGINFVYQGQVDGESKTSVCTLISGNLNIYGSEVKCGNEYFYVMPAHEEAREGTVSLLAKYNLNVGNYLASGDIGIQNEFASGYKYTYNESEGTYNYYLNCFAGNQNEDKCDHYYGEVTFLTEGTEYTDRYYLNLEDNEFVYDNRSNLYQYAEDYESYLKSIGVREVEVTLPDYYQMMEFGCQGDGYYTCEAVDHSYSWLYSTSYWLGSVNENLNDEGIVEYNLWYVSKHPNKPNGLLDDEGGNWNFSKGIRPIVIISISEIQ